MTGRSRQSVLELGLEVALGVEEQGWRRWYPSRVARVRDACAWIESPLSVEGIPRLEPGASVVLYCSRARDARYLVPGRLLDRGGADEGLLAVQVAEARRIQQRRYFRVPVANTTEQGVVALASGDRRSLRLQLREISACGFRARGDFALEPGDALQLRLRLPGQLEAFEVGAKVIRVLEPLRPEEPHSEFAASFDGLPEQVQERIVRFALRAQRETLRSEALA